MPPFGLKCFLTISLLFLICVITYGQPLDEIINSSDDTLKVQQLLDLAYALEIEDPDSAIAMYGIAAVIANKIDYKIGNGRAIQYTGIVLSDQGKYDEAIIYYQRAILVFETIPYEAGVASTYVNIGNIYKRKADYSKAIDNYLAGTRLFELIGDTSRLIYAYTNIGSVLSDVEQYDKSLRYNHRSLELSILVKDSASICDGLVNIGSIELDNGMLDDALLNYKSALRIAEKTDDTYMLFLIYNGLSNISARKNNYIKALQESKLSLNYATILGNPALVSMALAQTGYNFKNLRQLDSAGYYLNQSIQLAQRNQSREVLISAYLWMAELQEELNNHKSSLKWYKQYQLLQEAASGERQTRIVAGLEIEFETEKKDLELKEKSLEIERNEALLAKRNYFIIALFGALISALVFFLLVRRSLRQKKIIAEKDASIQQDKVAKLKKEQQVISLKSMMEGQEKERLRIAKDLHDGLGGMLSSIKLYFRKIGTENERLQESKDFIKAVDLLDTTSSEARKISHNLMPGALVKFGLVEALNDFCNNIGGSNSFAIEFQSYGIDHRLPEDKEIMIYRIVQELVNNIVKHAEASEAIVQLICNDKIVYLTVEDNGKGFNPTDIKKPGVGMNNIRSRVDYLNGKMEIDSKADIGTTVSVEITTD